MVVRLAQGQNFGDFEEHRTLTGVDHQRIGDRLIRDGVEVEAGAVDDVGLSAFFGQAGVHSQTGAVGFQVRLGLVVRQTELDVVLFVQLLLFLFFVF